MKDKPQKLPSASSIRD